MKKDKKSKSKAPLFRSPTIDNANTIDPEMNSVIPSKGVMKEAKDWLEIDDQ